MITFILVCVALWLFYVTFPLWILTIILLYGFIVGLINTIVEFLDYLYSRWRK